MQLTEVVQEQYELLTEEVEPYLKQVITWWYLEESNFSDTPPCLEFVLVDNHPYSHSFYECFAESLSWRRFHSGYGPDPQGDKYTDDDFTLAMEELSECFDHYFPQIRKDIMHIITSLNLIVFDFDNGNNDLIVNSSIQEVWS